LRIGPQFTKPPLSLGHGDAKAIADEKRRYWKLCGWCPCLGTFEIRIGFFGGLQGRRYATTNYFETGSDLGLSFASFDP
jgi:hypothetical protein